MEIIHDFLFLALAAILFIEAKLSSPREGKKEKRNDRREKN